MELKSAIERRRSVRKFSDKKVDTKLINEIIRLGTWGPTACNRQGWRFIVITDKSLMTKINNKGGSYIISKAPIGIIVLYNKFTINLYYSDNIESASACIQNMLLAITDLNLGACWINHLPPKSFLYRLFEIPKRYDIIGYIAIGYPADYPKPLPRKYSKVDELISYNKFEMDTEIEKRRINRVTLFILGIKHKISLGSPNFIKGLFLRLRKVLTLSRNT